MNPGTRLVSHDDDLLYHHSFLRALSALSLVGSTFSLRTRVSMCFIVAPTVLTMLLFALTAMKFGLPELMLKVGTFVYKERRAPGNKLNRVILSADSRR